MGHRRTGPLSRRARRLLADESNDLLFSAASIWEIQLKRRSGKLTLPAEPGFLQQHILRLGIQEVLSITPDHAYRVLSLSNRGMFFALYLVQLVLRDSTR